MDFWDLTKLLIRRWYIAMPMLVLSVALTVLTVGQVKPDYIATAYVQLVPPVLGPTKPGQATPDQRNPWLGQGLQTLGNAAIVTVTDQTVVKELEATGLSDSYTLTMASTSPMITFEVVGATEKQAQDTAEQLVGRFASNVTVLQSVYGVSAADRITARRLDLGTNVEQSDSKVKRALVAVAGVGLLLTAAVTIGLDAILRRRRRRAGAVRPAASDAQAPTQVLQPLPAPAGPAPVRAGGEPTIPAMSGPSSNGAPIAITPQPPGFRGGGMPARDSGVTRDLDGLTGVIVEYQAADGQTSTAADDGHRADILDVEAELPADATIVLPPKVPVTLQWPGHNGERKKRS